MSGLTIDYETADKITLLNLKDQREFLLKEIKEHLENGRYLHPDDYHNSITKLIPALEILIPYYGGNV
jgi:hypothetical protein